MPHLLSCADAPGRVDDVLGGRTCFGVRKILRRICMRLEAPSRDAPASINVDRTMWGSCPRYGVQVVCSRADGLNRSGDRVLDATIATFSFEALF
jgi:hypothetical protein